MIPPENGSDSRTRVLIVDDDVKLCRLVGDYLSPLGYEVVAAYSGTSGLALALNQTFSAVILDVMLPGMDGFTLLRQLREKSQVPVLMLTGRGEEPDRILGLEMGADDYLPKTFSTRELLARLRAVIRRSIVVKAAAEKAPEKVDVGELHIEPEARLAALAGEPLQLTAIEFDLLLSLARAAGRVKTREQLLLEVADRNFEVFDRSIDVHISSVRKKLGDDARSPRFIVTIRSAGYMMRRAGAEEPV
ncbi:MAG TPA: response regulator transcription factor [Bryobacteraceae bacterium]|nr:response regulator transcription factor [Bryobacteraceae bacterium]